MMGVLEEALVNRLLETSSVFKRDTMEGRIRSLLSAQPFRDVTGLPARRGAADGGIDGVINATIPGFSSPEQRVAINIKVRRSDFTREQLGGFILDMDRENIHVGIIITAAHLSPDAQAELERKNEQGQIRLFHIRLSEILSGGASLPNILINGERINIILAGNIRGMISFE